MQKQILTNCLIYIAFLCTENAQCNGHGACDNGQCDCENGWRGLPDCSGIVYGSMTLKIQFTEH